MDEIVKKGRKVIILKDYLKDWEGGVTIICKRCGDVPIVKENSLCDRWTLCPKCARQDIEAGRLKYGRR